MRNIDRENKTGGSGPGPEDLNSLLRQTLGKHNLPALAADPVVALAADDPIGPSRKGGRVLQSPQPPTDQLS